MDTNQILGTTTIIISLIGYFYAWKFQQKNNYKIALTLLVICGFLLRIYSSTDFFLHDWDERYHALVAKNFLKHFFTPTLYDTPILNYNFKDWPTNHIWLHKQPLPLWTIAISIWIFGVNEIAVRIPSILLTTAGIGLTYSIAKYFFDKRIAFLAAFFYSVNGLIVEMTGGRVATDHIDTFFLFFIELAIFFAIVFVQKRKTIYNILVGISIGLAILCKWLPALIVLPIWLLIVIDSKQFNIKTIISQFVLICIVSIIIFLPWQLYIYHTFPLESSWEAHYNYQHITQVLSEQGGPFYYYLTRIRINYGELIYLPIIWFIWTTIKKPIELKRLAICVWFIIPIAFFSLVQTKMQAYILFVSPALFMLTAEFIFFILTYKEKIKQKWLITIVIILFVLLPFRYMIERMKPFERRDSNPQWVIDLKSLNKKDYKNGVLFNYNKQIEAMFYTNLTVYNYIPKDTTINNLVKEGYTIIINDNGKIPNEIKSIKGLEYIHLTESTEIN